MPSLSRSTALLAAGALFVAACGGSDAPEALPVAEVDTTAAPTTAAPTTAAPTTTAPATTAAAGLDLSSFDPEQLADLETFLATPEGQQFAVQAVTQQTSMSAEQAECFLTNAPFEAMIGFVAGGSVGGDLDPGFVEAMTTCEIAPADLEAP